MASGKGNGLQTENSKEYNIGIVVWVQRIDEFNFENDLPLICKRWHWCREEGSNIGDPNKCNMDFVSKVLVVTELIICNDLFPNSKLENVRRGEKFKMKTLKEAIWASSHEFKGLPTEFNFDDHLPLTFKL